jgi:hypothetical protein
MRMIGAAGWLALASGIVGVLAVLLAAFLFALGDVQSLSASQFAPASATGSAHIVLSDRVDPVCGNSCSQRMTMNAVSIGDGDAVGQFDVRSEEGGGIRAHGSITCLTVDGNVAQLGGTVTQSNLPDFIGLQLTWLVVDNGEGINSATDQTTDLFTGDCERDLPSHPRFVLFDVSQGNIEVKD